MKAMILAAGHGTRLRPLTAGLAKALVPVGNKPVIDRLIHYLKAHKVSKIVVNAHHHSEQIVSHLDEGRPFGMEIRVLVEQEILGTGGGIRNAEWFWDEDPFIVLNGDIVTDINLDKAYERHVREGNLSTLVLHDYQPYNQVRVDNRMNVIDIAPQSGPHRLAFTGIHIISPELLGYIPAGVFSDIIDCYRELIRAGRPIGGYASEGHAWRDIGTVESYVLANREALGGRPFLLGRDCRISSSAILKEWAVIGPGTHLEAGVEVRRSILWEKARIRKGKRVVDSIVTASREIDYDLLNGIV